MRRHRGTQRNRATCHAAGTIPAEHEPRHPSITRTSVRHWVVGSRRASTLVGGRKADDPQRHWRPRARAHLQPAGADRGPHRLGQRRRGACRRRSARLDRPRRVCADAGSAVQPHRRVAGRRGRSTALRRPRNSRTEPRELTLAPVPYYALSGEKSHGKTSRTEGRDMTERPLSTSFTRTRLHRGHGPDRAGHQAAS